MTNWDKAYIGNHKSASELRRLHEVNEKLLEALKRIVNIGDKGAVAVASAAIAKATGEKK